MNPNQGGTRSAASRQVHGLVVAGLVSQRGAARLAWALTALSPLLLVLAVVLLVLNRNLGFRALSPRYCWFLASAWSGWCWPCADPAMPSAGCSSAWAWSPPSKRSRSSMRRVAMRPLRGCARIPGMPKTAVPVSLTDKTPGLFAAGHARPRSELVWPSDPGSCCWPLTARPTPR
jgi:hypothetical protein